MITCPTQFGSNYMPVDLDKSTAWVKVDDGTASGLKVVGWQDATSKFGQIEFIPGGAGFIGWEGCTSYDQLLHGAPLVPAHKNVTIAFDAHVRARRVHQLDVCSSAINPQCPNNIPRLPQLCLTPPPPRSYLVAGGSLRQTSARV